MKDDVMAVAPFTGLIVSTQYSTSDSFGTTFSVFHPNGHQISSTVWKSGQIVALFWAYDREIINVLTRAGKLLQVRGTPLTNNKFL